MSVAPTTERPGIVHEREGEESHGRVKLDSEEGVGGERITALDHHPEAVDEGDGSLEDTYCDQVLGIQAAPVGGEDRADEVHGDFGLLAEVSHQPLEGVAADRQHGFHRPPPIVSTSDAEETHGVQVAFPANHTAIA